jgi:hypothetical protein
VPRFRRGQAPALASPPQDGASAQEAASAASALAHREATMRRISALSARVREARETSIRVRQAMETRERRASRSLERSAADSRGARSEPVVRHSLSICQFLKPRHHFITGIGTAPCPRSISPMPF